MGDRFRGCPVLCADSGTGGAVRTLKAVGVVLALTVGLVVPGGAQEPVRSLPDKVSYGTALINPAIAAYRAARSAHPWCELGRLGLSEAIGNVSVFALQRFVVSPRPCLGCGRNGLPSGHAMNSVIGISSTWRFGIYFSVATAHLRSVSNQHTKTQAALGLLLGAGAEVAGQKLLRCPS